MLTDDVIMAFLSPYSGYGDGSGSGDGYGSSSGSSYSSGSGDGYGSSSGSSYSSGSGYGYGSGDGDGYGDGSGDGSGYGDGDGYGDGYGIGYGYGSGSSYGSGYGYGDGSGIGYGYGDGDGSGDGYGDGYGNGYGNITKVGVVNIYPIDNEPTAIYSIHGNYARCGVLRQDFTFVDCYVARCGNSFAHGITLQQAIADARAKAMRTMPVDERIGQFLAAYPDQNKPIPAKELFDWHNILTSSCLFGRKQFCAERGIDVEHDNFTVKDFIKLTINSYGGDVIAKLKKRLDAQ